MCIRDRILEAIVNLIPPPQGDPQKPLSALIFDSHFDSYRGVIPCIRVVDGQISKGMKIKMFGSGKTAEVTEVGVYNPAELPVDQLSAGEVGYFAAAIKNVRDTQVGDTVTSAEHPADHPLPGYRQATSMVSVSYTHLLISFVSLWLRPPTAARWYARINR